MDILAFLAWNLPEAARLFPSFPSRLTVVSANEPMWRGGLSAPSSLFIQASLPLLSENGTSTLLHELMHIGIGNSAGHNADWIVEGMAEYYSLKLLYRSGTISKRRFEKSLAALEKWGREAADLCVGKASGAVDARFINGTNVFEYIVRGRIMELWFELDVQALQPVCNRPAEKRLVLGARSCECDVFKER